MILGIDLVDDALEDTFGVEDEGLAERTHADLAVILLLTPSAKSLKHGGGGIAEERERQIELLLELDMRGLGILAHAIDLIAPGEERVVIVADIARLGGAAGCGILGVEIDDGGAAEQILVGNHPALFVCRAESRHLVSNL